MRHKLTSEDRRRGGIARAEKARAERSAPPAPAETFLAGKVTLFPGDCLEVLDRLPAGHFHSALSDPPYHLQSIQDRFADPDAAPAKSDGATGVYKRASAGFMGKRWDGGDVAFRPETWRKVFRVLRPGGHLLAFGASRNYHRLACAIEDAGFEVRDMMQWLYGSGFPKALNIALEFEKTLCHHVEPGAWFYIEDGERMRREPPFRDPRAQEWAGWATALKPAQEPICLARKPLGEGMTNAENVEAFGAGALNIDACRIGTKDDLNGGAYSPDISPKAMAPGGAPRRVTASGDFAQPSGRWPANVIHDGSADVLAGFPEVASGSRKAGEHALHGYSPGVRPLPALEGSDGSAGRFFYTPKADVDDRAGSDHPTVKPPDLLQYLARLITPPGGSLLDPFAGTGTTGEAAWREGFSATLIEADARSCDDIRRRMALALAGPEERSRAIVAARGKLETVDALPLFSSQ